MVSFSFILICNNIFLDIQVLSKKAGPEWDCSQPSQINVIKSYEYSSVTILLSKIFE